MLKDAESLLPMQKKNLVSNCYQKKSYAKLHNFSICYWIMYSQNMLVA
jgi:hypothetical protein